MFSETPQSPYTTCFDLPTEKIGFPSQLCVEIDPDKRTAKVFLVVFGISITIGEVSETDTSVTVDLGPVVSGIGGTVTALLHTQSMCLSICFNIKYGSGKTTLAQYLVMCSIFSAHPQFGFYPNNQINVLSDNSPICGHVNQSSNDFTIKQPDTFIIEAEKDAIFKLYRKSILGEDTVLGTYKNGGSVDQAPYPIHLSIGDYYIGNPERREKAFTVIFRRLSSL